MMPRTLSITFALIATAATAEPPGVENVSASRTGDSWTFNVTISHPDTGWEHYADAWRVLDMSGKELAIRELAHPHVNEQPFTRSLSGVRLPQGTTEVQIQARELPGGWSPQTQRFKLPQ